MIIGSLLFVGAAALVLLAGVGIGMASARNDTPDSRGLITSMLVISLLLGVVAVQMVYYDGVTTGQGSTK